MENSRLFHEFNHYILKDLNYNLRREMINMNKTDFNNSINISMKISRRVNRRVIIKLILYSDEIQLIVNNQQSKKFSYTFLFRKIPMR